MQTEYTGNGSFYKIQGILDEIQGKKIFLVTGKRSFSLSGAETKLEKLLNRKTVCIFNNFQTNPEISDVKRGISLLKRHKPDFVIAIGGGSVLDMAKLINIFSAQTNPDLISIIKNPKLIINKGLPLIAIPTTSGSGSHATHFSVVYVKTHKHSLAHNYLLPNYVILDPCLSYKTSRQVAASSAMDALSQAVESYWSLGATKESQNYASDAIKLILNFIFSAVNSKNNDAMDAISLASHLSGKAINITKTTAPHAISYILTSHFKIPHGHAVSIMLAPVAYISYKKSSGDSKKNLEKVFGFFDCNSIGEFCDIWIYNMKTLGMSTNLVESGILLNDIDYIVNNVNIERLSNHCVGLDIKDIVDIVKLSFNYQDSYLELD